MSRAALIRRIRKALGGQSFMGWRNTRGSERQSRVTIATSIHVCIADTPAFRNRVVTTRPSQNRSPSVKLRVMTTELQLLPSTTTSASPTITASDHLAAELL